jgi:replicative DNA helicase
MRIGSNLFSISLDSYEEWAKDQDNLKQKISSIKNHSLKPYGILHVKEFPSSTCSVNDLRNYLVKTQDILGVKFDNVFVDYINIMKNWRNPNTENTYMKIKQISEDLRAMAMQQNWAVVSATQTNRSGIDNTDLKTTDISESAALLHTVDVLFGIITDPLMKAKGEYYLKCLANRVSGYENTKKLFLWERQYARIAEDRNSPIQDTEFMINSFLRDNKFSSKEHKTTTDIDVVISKSVIPTQSDSTEKIPDISCVNVTGGELF